MKKIHKSEAAPLVLSQHTAPTSESDIDSSVYAASEVKTQLLQDQFYACAYCEIPLEGPFADVEHFRPKCSYRQSREDEHHKPGYYRLAYDWQNLLVSCNQCNRVLKNDLFPLENPSQRDISGLNISRECPLLLHPAIDDPAAHITYREAIAIPVLHDGIPDARGQYTIDCFQLNKRPVLLQLRRKRWEQYRLELRKLALAQAVLQSEASADVKTTARQLLDACRESLRKFISPDGDFSGMFQGLRRFPCR